jgi:hypothetical protein
MHFARFSLAQMNLFDAAPVNDAALSVTRPAA